MELRGELRDETSDTVEKAVIIADSHGHRIIPEQLTEIDSTDMITAYTFAEAEQAIQEGDNQAELICLQVGTNDARNPQESIESCVRQWITLINSIRAKYSGAKVVIGTIPPFRDPVTSHKAHKINIQVQAHFYDDDHIKFADNNTINYIKDPNAIFQHDGIHFKDLGFKRLVQNIKRTIFRRV